MRGVYGVLVQVKNGTTAKLTEVSLQFSKDGWDMAAFLYSRGLISGFKFEHNFKMKLFLKYDSQGKGLIQKVNIRSKPGRRYYAKYSELLTLEKAFTWMIKTEKGIISLQEALKFRRGGELLGFID